LERFGTVISPVIIASLIVYSYATLKIDDAPAWKTCWPYLAGALTVALQLLFRSSLFSIIAGTALYMALSAFAGCKSYGDLHLDARNPVVSISPVGVSFAGVIVKPEKVPRILESYEVPHDRTIHIMLNSDMRNLASARQLMAILCKAGYRRPVLVTERKAHGQSTGRIVTPHNKGSKRGFRPVSMTNE
jgi:hypothetical protein